MQIDRANNRFWNIYINVAQKSRYKIRAIVFASQPVERERV